MQNFYLSHTGGVGSVKDVEMVNFGFNYSSAPTFNAFRHAVIKDITGTFSVGDVLTSHSGTVTAFDVQDNYFH